MQKPDGGPLATFAVSVANMAWCLILEREGYPRPFRGRAFQAVAQGRKWDLLIPSPGREHRLGGKVRNKCFRQRRCMTLSEVQCSVFSSPARGAWALARVCESLGSTYHGAGSLSPGKDRQERPMRTTVCCAQTRGTHLSFPTELSVFKDANKLSRSYLLVGISRWRTKCLSVACRR